VWDKGRDEGRDERGGRDDRRCEESLEGVSYRSE